MKEPVQEEDANLVAQAVAVGRGLTESGFERDSEVAGVGLGDFGGRWEAEDVGSFVLAAEGLIQAAQGGIVGQKNIHFAFEAYCSAGAVEEARHAGL